MLQEEQDRLHDKQEWIKEKQDHLQDEQICYVQDEQIGCTVYSEHVSM